MKNALLLHGKPKRERYLNPDLPKPHKANWFPSTAEELERRGIPTVIPAFPKPYAPNYALWRATFEQYRYRVTARTIVAAHSAGAGFIVRWLSENPDVSIERAVLVGLWHDKDHEFGKDFFDYQIDPNLAQRVGKITIFNSVDDGKAVQQSVAMLREAIPGIHYREFEGYGHFMLGNNMTRPEFPELVAELVS